MDTYNYNLCIENQTIPSWFMGPKLAVMQNMVFLNFYYFLANILFNSQNCV